MKRLTDHVTIEKVSDHIPDDLAFSIMLKLPLKSLKRFSCVHKSWSFLFENPYFMNLYLDNFISSDHSSYEGVLCLHIQHIMPYFQNRPVIYLLSGERFENKVKLDWPPLFQENDRGVCVFGSAINGIVCLYQGLTPTVVLCNPSTMEFKALPPSPTEILAQNVIGFFFLHGFGYDHFRDDYKVIRHISYSLNGYNVEEDMDDTPNKLSYDDMWEIYSLRSNSWRKLDINLTYGYGSYVSAFVYVNGMCHWWNDDDDDPLLVSFDLRDEVCYTTSIPLNIPTPLDLEKIVDFIFVNRHLVVLNESIGLISNYANTSTTFHISILGELGVKESWTKLFIIGPLPCIESPIGEGNNGDLFFKRKDGKIARFNLKTQMVEELGIKGQFCDSQVVICKKNLLCIGRINN
ncbi:unnamed protein product [Lathyrus oleraceus]|uniref:F-box/kelch-repeat protein At3g06240-like n=1 Tax=Pisum sativum TaxID=3888 RepID=UPI001FC40F5D|nr:F-box/kelch-repeat protein At3g06240-like [Pisum sativum]